MALWKKKTGFALPKQFSGYNDLAAKAAKMASVNRPRYEYVWNVAENGRSLQAVNRKMHRTFTHAGEMVLSRRVK